MLLIAFPLFFTCFPTLPFPLPLWWADHYLHGLFFLPPLIYSRFQMTVGLCSVERRKSRKWILSFGTFLLQLLLRHSCYFNFGCFPSKCVFPIGEMWSKDYRFFFWVVTLLSPAFDFFPAPPPVNTFCQNRLICSLPFLFTNFFFSPLLPFFAFEKSPLLPHFSSS